MDETMWVRTDVVLPPAGQEVLIWTDMIHIARCSERGITKEEREKMRRGELPNPIETGLSMVGKEHEFVRYHRSEIYKDEDEWGNNQKPYNWIGRGHSKFFGQEVKWWMPLPTRPCGEKEKATIPPWQDSVSPVADLAMGLILSAFALNQVNNLVKEDKEERPDERREN